MENNELNASKQFLSKMEEGQAKLYFDIGNRVHSYFEKSKSETKQFIELLIPQDVDDSAKYLELLQNFELLQGEFQKLKNTNKNQQTKIQKLIDENARLSRKTTSKKEIENDGNQTDEPNTVTKKPRKSKNTKNIGNVQYKDDSEKQQLEMEDYKPNEQSNEHLNDEPNDDSELNETQDQSNK